MTPAERAQRVAAAHASWARTTNRVGRVLAGADALEARIARDYDIPADLPAAEYAQRIRNAKTAYFRNLAARSAKARAAKREAGAA